MKTLPNAICTDVSERFTNNLLALYGSVRNTQNDWYNTAFWWIAEKANTYSVSMERVAFVVATLSPALSWKANKESAEAFFQEWAGLPATARQTAYGANVAKCWAYMAQGELRQPTGRKVSAFYKNLLGDYSVVTIDRHAIRAARWGKRDMDKESGTQDICKQEFDIITQAYILAANMVGEKPARFQAKIWSLFCQ